MGVHLHVADHAPYYDSIRACIVIEAAGQASVEVTLHIPDHATNAPGTYPARPGMVGTVLCSSGHYHISPRNHGVVLCSAGGVPVESWLF